MAESNTEQWYPTAAYLYVLHLDGPALAWEYLRRNPAYRRDWLRGEADLLQVARRWGLRLLEDPDCDARDAQPDWLSDPDSLVHLSGDRTTDAEARPLHVWELPGYRYLTHDGERLVLTSQLPQHILRLAIPITLEDGQPFAYAVHAGANLQRRWRSAAGELRWLDPSDANHIAVSANRPDLCRAESDGRGPGTSRCCNRRRGRRRGRGVPRRRRRAAPHIGAVWPRPG